MNGVGNDQLNYTNYYEQNRSLSLPDCGVAEALRESFPAQAASPQPVRVCTKLLGQSVPMRGSCQLLSQLCTTNPAAR